jgi:phenylpropionate dioxygenase-like ring-hydroxylating dioxygenase large terminal subunit
MQQKTQTELALQIFTHLDAGTTALAETTTKITASSYTCAERLAKEQQLLFRKEPLLIALSCDLPQAKDYLTDDSSGVAILLVRDEGGVVHAFINACKHRGARLVEGQGRLRKRITCPYHAWSYDLQGHLNTVPHKEGFSDFDIAKCQLTKVPCLEKDGLIWLRPGGGDLINADEHLGALTNEFKSYNFIRHHHFATRHIECEMNWKIIIDSFMEPYHVAYLHKTVAKFFFPNFCLFDAFGKNLREILPRRSIMDIRETPQNKWDLINHAIIIYFIYPNTVMLIQEDHTEIWRTFPRNNRPDQSSAYFHFYTHEPVETCTRAHWEQALELTLRTVIQEDFLVGEGAQRNYASGAIESVIYGRNEPALAYFQKTIATAISTFSK